MARAASAPAVASATARVAAARLGTARARALAPARPRRAAGHLARASLAILPRRRRASVRCAAGASPRALPVVRAPPRRVPSRGNNNNLRPLGAPADRVVLLLLPDVPLPLAPTRVASPGTPRGELDVVALGNMCVDILLPQGPIPAPDALKTASFLDDLASRDVPTSAWEIGGNCNFLVAASRVGLRCECVGHVDDDAHGRFLVDALAEEGVPFRRICSRELVDAAVADREKARDEDSADAFSTLKCFVLTDGAGGHAFCSRYDLGPWPLFPDVRAVDDDAARALGRCRAVFVNGFVFDEMAPAAVGSAIAIAKANGANVFFDPGPRAFTFVKNDSERREALDLILGAADVILATLDEAAALVGGEEEGGGGGGESADGALESSTAVGASYSEAEGYGKMDPLSAATALFRRPGCVAEWVVIKCGPDGASVFTRRGDQVYVGSPRVEVGDTVGCGDSAAAAVVLGYAEIKKARKKLFDASSGKIAYLPNAKLAGMMEATLTLATAVGAATATKKGAGRNVADLETVEALLDKCAEDEEACAGFGGNADASERAKKMLDESLRRGGKR